MHDNCTVKTIAMPPPPSCDDVRITDNSNSAIYQPRWVSCSIKTFLKIFPNIFVECKHYKLIQKNPL